MVAQMFSIARCLTVTAGLIALSASTSAAQALATNFDQLQFKVKKGDTLFITSKTGYETSVSLVEISKGVLLVDQGGSRREFAESEVTQIRQRLPDPLWTGAVIGFGVGAVLGGLAASFDEGCSHDSTSCISPVLWTGGLGAGIGVGIDALIKGRKVIYRAPVSESRSRVTVLPVVSAATKGVAIRVNF